MIKVEKAFKDQDIVEKLLIRADIRRTIQRSEPDRIADLCEEAASEITLLRFLLETANKIILDKGYESE